MIKENILIFGAGAVCRYTMDIILAEDRYKICGIIDSELEIGQDYFGYRILGQMSDLPSILDAHNLHKGIIAISDNFTRYKVAKEIGDVAGNFEFISAVHPNTVIGGNVKISDGCLIMSHAVINNGAELGQHCFMGTSSSLDHDSFLGNYSSLGPKTTVGGNVKIGECTAISLGVNIINEIAIGNHSVVGAGSLVLKNLGDNIVAYGSPAKEVKKRTVGEKYLG